MNFKTIGLSLLMHVSFFAVFFLLSATFSGSNSNGMREKVFFVRLAEEVNRYIDKRPAERPGAVTLKKDLSRERQGKGSAVEAVSGEGGVKDPVGHLISPVRSAMTSSPAVEDMGRKGEGYGAYEQDRGSVFFTGRNTSVEVSPGQSFTDLSGVPEVRDGSMPNPEIIEIIQRAIERVKKYPPVARKRGIEGTVHVGFRIGSNGEPRDVGIVRTSGSAMLDAAAVGIVKSAAPFPLVDAVVEVPVVFRLN